MALGKSSKKTPKTISEVPSKSKVTSSKAKTQSVHADVERPKASAEALTISSRRKSAAVVNVESTVQDRVVMQPAGEPLRAMAAAAGSSEHAEAVADPIAAVNGSRHTGIGREQIAHLAYQYWVERGYAHGSAEDDWKRAEAELGKIS